MSARLSALFLRTARDVSSRLSTAEGLRVTPAPAGSMCFLYSPPKSSDSRLRRRSRSRAARAAIAASASTPITMPAMAPPERPPPPLLPPLAELEEDEEVLLPEVPDAEADVAEAAFVEAETVWTTVTLTPCCTTAVVM